jgi:hypothetical protein
MYVEHASNERKGFLIMSKIKNIIDSLTPETRKRLQEAFDNQEPFYTIYYTLPSSAFEPLLMRKSEEVSVTHPTKPVARYIGVNVEKIECCHEDERIGEYSLGRLHGNP